MDFMLFIDVAEKVIAGASVVAFAIAKVFPRAGRIAGLLEKAHKFFGLLGLNSEVKPKGEFKTAELKLRD